MRKLDCNDTFQISIIDNDCYVNSTALRFNERGHHVSVATTPCFYGNSNRVLGASGLRQTVGSYNTSSVLCIPTNSFLANTLQLRDSLRVCLTGNTILRNAAGVRSCSPHVPDQFRNARVHYCSDLLGTNSVGRGANPGYHGVVVHNENAVYNNKRRLTHGVVRSRHTHVGDFLSSGQRLIRDYRGDSAVPNHIHPQLVGLDGYRGI